MKKIYIKQFGCPTMKYFVNKLTSELVKLGYYIFETKDLGQLSIGNDDFNFAKEADVCIFFTCGIVEFCQNQILKFVNRVRSDKKNAAIILTGCMAEGFEKYTDKFKNIDFISTEPEDIVRYLVQNFPAENKNISQRVGRGQETVEILVKSGCDKCCTYCIEPRLRRKSKFFSQYPSLETIINSIKEVERTGAKYVRLVGVCLGDWREKEGNLKFEDLLIKILKETSVSIVELEFHPKDITKAIISLLSHERIGNSISIPIESGSNRILKRMNRRYTAEYLRTIFKDIYKEVPNMRISTNVIVGFPGETEQDFKDTCSLLSDIPFDNVFIMRFNKRPGAIAATMSQQLTNTVKYRRLKKLAGILQRMHRDYCLRDL
jgi:tRNA-2-methylthio-N6-dimethylallyladenosine synthase